MPMAYDIKMIRVVGTYAVVQPCRSSETFLSRDGQTFRCIVCILINERYDSEETF